MSEDTRHVIVEDDALAAGFTQIPHLVLRRPDLQPGAKLTYMVLLSYAWQHDHTYPGTTALAVPRPVHHAPHAYDAGRGRSVAT